MTISTQEMIRTTKEIVMSHLNNSTVSADAIPGMIRGVYEALVDIQQMNEARLGNAAAMRVQETQAPETRRSSLPPPRATLKDMLQNAERASVADASPQEAQTAATDARDAKVEELPQPTNQKPAVPIEESVTPDAIICLEDGRKFTMMKRWLASKYSMTPEQYRAKWGLPDDYPMVAPNYSRAKSVAAKLSGFGKDNKKRSRGKADNYASASSQ